MTPPETGTGPSTGHGGGTTTGPSTGHGGETGTGHGGETSADHVTAKASNGKTS